MIELSLDTPELMCRFFEVLHGHERLVHVRAFLFIMELFFPIFSLKREPFLYGH